MPIGSSVTVKLFNSVRRMKKKEMRVTIMRPNGDAELYSPPACDTIMVPPCPMYHANQVWYSLVIPYPQVSCPTML